MAAACRNRRRVGLLMSNLLTFAARHARRECTELLAMMSILVILFSGTGPQLFLNQHRNVRQIILRSLPVLLSRLDRLVLGEILVKDARHARHVLIARRRRLGVHLGMIAFCPILC